jgi:uncharacterized membrane protein HdeD (DUF308 family)
MNYLVGAILILAGIYCALFKKTVGIAFCRFGKKSWKDSPFGLSKIIESTYDEQTAPWFFIFLGVVLVAMGVLFFFANG